MDGGAGARGKSIQYIPKSFLIYLSNPFPRPGSDLTGLSWRPGLL